MFDISEISLFGRPRAHPVSITPKAIFESPRKRFVEDLMGDLPQSDELRTEALGRVKTGGYMNLLP